jgi:hypothetical protein
VYPAPSENVFSAQASHACEPDTALYFPGAHAVHGNPLGPVNPALHEQFVTVTLASADHEYAGHWMHGDVFVVFLYLPTSHWAHGPFTAPVYPTTHSQNEEPLAASLNSTHGTQLVKPTLPEYVFAAHSEQFHEPETILYSPALHAVHGSPFGPVNPALHEQLVIFTLASADHENAGHPVHAHAPVVFLYLPTSHSTHGPPPGPVYPTLQRQSTIRPIAGSAAE